MNLLMSKRSCSLILSPACSHNSHSHCPPIAKAAPSSSFHKRILPLSLISLSSRKGKDLFREALGHGSMESFFPLSEQFVTQSEPALCSLSSLAMVLNALSFDPKRIWKGAWRWVSEDMLKCESADSCGHSFEKIKVDGMDFNEFEALAHCHGVQIQSHRAAREEIEIEGSLCTTHKRGLVCESTHKRGLESFRNEVRSISASDEATSFIIVNFSRKHIQQSGSGHFSPIGGYHPEKDLVLVMDTARFKYPPFWVPTEQLYKSMAEKDENTGRERGYFVIHASSQISRSVTEIELQECSTCDVKRSLGHRDCCKIGMTH